jgi:hypothetical protein
MTAMRSVILYFLACALMFGCSQRADDTAAREAQAAFEKALIERADRLELDTAYVPPPGDPMAHHTMGFARTPISQPKTLAISQRRMNIEVRSSNAK